MAISGPEFQAFRLRQRRLWKLMWVVVFALAVGSFFALGAIWSYAAGLVAVAVIPLVGYEALRRWNRERWLRRFPELREADLGWRFDPEASDRRLG